MKNFIYLILINLFTTCLLSQNSDWVYRNTLPQNDFYAVKFFNQNTGIVCGSNGIILKTVSGDNNWINLSIDESLDLYGMYFTDVNRGIIVGENGLIIKTGNGGFSWQRMVSPTANTLRSVTFVDLFYGFAVGDNGIIIKSTNGGDHWSVNYNAPRNLRCVYFIDENTGYAVGDSGLFLKTTNTGENWSTETIGIMNLTSVWFTDQVTGYLATAGQPYSIPLKTTDGGLTWSTMYPPFPNREWYKVMFTNQDTGYLVGRENPIAKTTNAGENWSEYNSINLYYDMRDFCFADTLMYVCGGDGCILTTSVNSEYTKFIGGSRFNIASFNFLNENTGYAVGGYEYFRTTNGGLNWNIDLTGWFSWFECNSTYPIKIKFFSPSSGYRLMYVFTPAWYPTEYLEKSTDGGLTWYSTYFPYMGWIYAFTEISGTTFICTYEGILKNSGSGWDTLYNPNPPIPFQDISFSNQNTGIAIFNNPYEGYVRTSDGGSSWSIVQFTNTVDMNEVQLLASGTGYIIGDSTLLSKTTDYGNTWNPIPYTMPVDFLDVQFIDDNTGWITGRFMNSPYSRRLYYTSNGGNDIIQIQSLGSFDVKGISFINALTGFVCGDSGVVLKTTNGGLSFVNPISYNVPDKFSLHQNYPNPFNPVTKIKFDIAKREVVKLKIFDLLGREISTIVNEQLKPGTYEFEWDGSNYSSGIYFYEIISDKFTETRKMVLIK
jgi:photosystem II stability/assembly factor-like uncharacterized protein